MAQLVTITCLRCGIFQAQVDDDDDDFEEDDIDSCPKCGELIEDEEQNEDETINEQTQGPGHAVPFSLDGEDDEEQNDGEGEDS